MRFEAQGTVPPQMERHRLRASCHPRRQEEGEGWRQRSRVYAEEMVYPRHRRGSVLIGSSCSRIWITIGALRNAKKTMAVVEDNPQLGTIAIALSSPAHPVLA